MNRGDDLILIGGAPRSGTTLLRAIIGASSNIFCGPELRTIPSLCTLCDNITDASGPTLSRAYGVDKNRIDAAAAGAIAAFLAPAKKASGAVRAAEKTPTNILHFPTLRRLFPDAYLISIVRDGRDVVSSLLQMTWRDARTGEPMAVTQSPQMAANLWAASVANDQAMAGDKRFFSLRYEDLVRSPAEEITKLFDFLGEPTPNLALYHDHVFDALEGENEASAARVAEPIDTTAIGRWRKDLAPGQLASVNATAGPWLERYGYV
ncbi:sulfotransferase family protein [Hyphococcus sp.]|uniref:sulfotransferase family protein n=1 Tax=Hyphococcus sp. TaxID=2038636 RepID=UPI0035C6EC47